MRITLKEHLMELQVEENQKPAHRRKHVPELQELAEDVGISVPTISRLVNNRTRYIDSQMIDNIVKAMRGRGFDTRLEDIVQEENELLPAAQEVLA